VKEADAMTTITEKPPTTTGEAATRREVYESPIGPLTLVTGVAGIRALRFPGDPIPGASPRSAARPAPAIAQLDEYFAGRRRAFELDLELRGNPFQLAVWHELRRIPFGTTVSYKELASRVERPDRIRAVGGCVARTPVPIIVPCHRVIGSDGSLTGYGGGLERKAFLLEHERRVSAGLDPAPAWAFRQEALL
jgi:methylated-DNA-[protein]-cysteine S-methyltransferase